MTGKTPKMGSLDMSQNQNWISSGFQAVFQPIEQAPSALRGCSHSSPLLIDLSSFQTHNKIHVPPLISQTIIKSNIDEKQLATRFKYYLSYQDGADARCECDPSHATDTRTMKCVNREECSSLESSQSIQLTDARNLSVRGGVSSKQGYKNAFYVGRYPPCIELAKHQKFFSKKP